MENKAKMLLYSNILALLFCLGRMVMKNLCILQRDFQFQHLNLTHDFDMRLEPLVKALLVGFVVY